jgi:hypothetical protein
MSKPDKFAGKLSFWNTADVYVQAHGKTMEAYENAALYVETMTDTQNRRSKKILLKWKQKINMHSSTTGLKRS